MTIIEVCNKLFSNRKLIAKRKEWSDEIIAIYQIGWASVRITDKEDPESTDPRDYYLQYIENNRLIDIFYPTLEDILADDWEIINETK